MFFGVLQGLGLPISGFESRVFRFLDSGFGRFCILSGLSYLSALQGFCSGSAVAGLRCFWVGVCSVSGNQLSRVVKDYLDLQSMRNHGL